MKKEIRLQCDNKYEFEAGDVVEIVGEVPLKGKIGLVQSCHSEKQFGVYFGNISLLGELQTITFWSANLKLLESHRQEN